MNKIITLIFILFSTSAFAGGSDQYTCTKVKKQQTCKTKVVVKYKTKVRYSVIDRPVQEIVMRTKVVTHKNRLSLFIGQAYDNDATLKTTNKLTGPYNSTLVQHKTLEEQKKKNNIGIQYMRDLYIRPTFSIHGLIQYQTISGASVGLGIGF